MIELLVTVVLSVVIAGAVSQMISRPMEAYASSSHRAKLLDAANVASSLFTREIRGALPNSIRVGCSGQCIEFLRAIDGARYRSAGPGDVLDFDPANADTQFEVIGPLVDGATIRTGSSADDCRLGNADCIAIYNTGQINSSAWNMDNIATITTLASPFSTLGFNNGGFSSGDTAFPVASPQQRFHIVSGPISYVCDTTAGTLRRYDSYPISASHSSVDSDAELIALSATAAVVSNKLSACDFDYDPGSLTRSGLVSFRMTISESVGSGHSESISLIKQAHVNNAP